MKIETFLIICVILAIAVNLGCLYGIYKCFSTGNYPLGIVLTVFYLGCQIAQRGNK